MNYGIRDGGRSENLRGRGMSINVVGIIPGWEKRLTDLPKLRRGGGAPPAPGSAIPVLCSISVDQDHMMMKQVDIRYEEKIKMEEKRKWKGDKKGRAKKKKGKLRSKDDRMINQMERNLESFLCNGLQQIKLYVYFLLNCTIHS